MSERAIEAAAKAMIVSMFAPHELPVDEDIWHQYVETARAALAAAQRVVGEDELVRAASRLEGRAEGWRKAIEAVALVEPTWAARALALSPGKVEEWLPIETAPKDGTRILGWDSCAKYPCVIFWEGRWREGFSADDNPDCTHWQPLPAPPPSIEQKRT